METQLRDLLSAAVGEPPHPVTVESVRRRVARRRRAEVLTATFTAVAVIAGLAVTLTAGAAGPNPTAGHPLRDHAPAFYVQQISHGRSTRTLVRSTATGAVTARVHSPWHHADIANIAAASGGTFFMVCQQVTDFRVTGSRIYRFQVTGSGRINGYTLVRGGKLGPLRVGSLAVTPGGSEVAVTTAAGPSPGGATATSIVVINTRTGAHAVWRSGRTVPGTMTFSPGSLSLTANGRELVYLGFPRCATGKKASTCTPTGNGEEVRAVSPAARGGSLDSSKLLVRQATLAPLSTGYINDAVVSPDGSTVTVVLVNTHTIRLPEASQRTGRPSAASSAPASTRPSRPRVRIVTTVSLVQVSASTGRKLRVLYQVRTGNGFFYRFFSSDPSGRHLILNVGPTTGTVNGWVDHGRLITLKPANGTSVFYEAW